MLTHVAEATKNSQEGEIEDDSNPVRWLDTPCDPLSNVTILQVSFLSRLSFPPPFSGVRDATSALYLGQKCQPKTQPSCSLILPKILLSFKPSDWTGKILWGHEFLLAYFLIVHKITYVLFCHIYPRLQMSHDFYPDIYIYIHVYK